MKKSINVRYFALFREQAGIDGETLELSAATAGDVFRQLAHRHGAVEPLAHCKVAINDEMVDWDAPVADGDTVLLFPPVAGG
ncbi:MAG TPA: MoaD/ThiS family protein [Woeseiaceae bacterium]|nr:MoaD/ThiS family protein [Woeseiaceae bacterium]